MHSELQWEAWANAMAEHEYVVIDGYLPDDLLHLLEGFFSSTRTPCSKPRWVLGRTVRRP